MKKISTVEIDRVQVFKENRLTIGLDLGDRSSHYCIVNEAGEIILERKLPTTPKGMEEVFRKIPRSRIALETGTHSPWISRQLNQLGHEVIVAHARNVRLIGESSRKDDRLDARMLARVAEGLNLARFVVVKEVGGEFIRGFWEPGNQREYVVFRYCGCEFALLADHWFTVELPRDDFRTQAYMNYRTRPSAAVCTA
jgi:Transposase